MGIRSSLVDYSLKKIQVKKNFTFFGLLSMYALNNDKGMSTAAPPDVCKTPVPSPTGVVITPIPYPNVAQCQMAESGSWSEKVFITGANALNLQTTITSTDGDQAGVNKGVASNTVMGKAKFLNGSLCVMIEGAAAVRLGSGVGHNGDTPNTIGVVGVPSQSKVMIMR